jgi:choline binding protein J
MSIENCYSLSVLESKLAIAKLRKKERYEEESFRAFSEQSSKTGQVLGEQRYRSFSTKDNHSWQKNGEFWYFIPLGEDALKDDWAKIDSRWYHFSKNGEMEKGWILDQGRYYYLAGDGGMLSW